MRLQTKILAFLLPLAAAAGVGLTLLSRREVGDILRRQVAEQGLSLARDLAVRGQKPLSEEDERRLLPLLQSALPRGAVYALALDAAGRVVAHTNVAETGKVYGPALGGTRGLSGPAVTDVDWNGEPVLEVGVPVGRRADSGGGEEDLLNSLRGEAPPVAGVLRIGMPMKEALRTQASISQRVFLVVAGVGLLAILLALLLIRRLLMPVEELDRATARLAKGEFGVEVAGGRADELGRLSRSFNRLSRDLKKQIEERQKTQEQLLQSQKMEIIGQLAGGVAHDFNNLLTIIQGFVHMILAEPDNEEIRKEGLTQVKMAATRAAALTHQLLAFSRKQVLQPVPLCLNAVINDMGKMLARLLGESVAIENLLEPNLKFIKADPGQIEQVVLNLVVNARDAMAGGGRVRIETSNVSLPGNDGLPQDWVCLTVRDNGMGMTEEVKAHIFEPFFTTKAVGKGTGLGMSTVFGIVQQSGGHIKFDTELGKGTAFHILLPSTTEVAPPDLSARGALPSGRGETILVVEDDPNIRLLLRRVLEIGGYSVVEAAGPEAAFIVMTSGETRVDLLLTDVVMPGMNGRVLAEKLSRFQKDLPVVFMSGHTEDALLLSGIRAKDIPFLSKPFSPETLLRKLREVLDAKAEGPEARGTPEEK